MHERLARLMAPRLSLALATPFFIFFGALSDRIGRKRIIMFGCVLAAVTYFPIFKQLTKAANPAIFDAANNNPVTVVASEDDCSFQFDPVGKRTFKSSCDIAKSWLAKKAISYSNEAAAPGTPAAVKIGDRVIASFDGRTLPAAEFKAKMAEFDKSMNEAARRHAGRHGPFARARRGRVRSGFLARHRRQKPCGGIL